MRGIYQNYEDKLENANFFNHQRRLTGDWYSGTTGIDPIDDATNIFPLASISFPFSKDLNKYL